MDLRKLALRVASSCSGKCVPYSVLLIQFINIRPWIVASLLTWEAANVWPSGLPDKGIAR